LTIIIIIILLFVWLVDVIKVPTPSTHTEENDRQNAIKVATVMMNYLYQNAKQSANSSSNSRNAVCCTLSSLEIIVAVIDDLPAAPTEGYVCVPYD